MADVGSFCSAADVYVCVFLPVDGVLGFLCVTMRVTCFKYVKNWSLQINTAPKAPERHTVHLHAQSSQAMVIARLGRLIGLLSFSQYTLYTNGHSVITD